VGTIEYMMADTKKENAEMLKAEFRQIKPRSPRSNPVTPVKPGQTRSNQFS
jgi:hypothetical protein